MSIPRKALLTYWMSRVSSFKFLETEKVSDWQGIQLLDLVMIKTRIKWAGHSEGNFGATRALYEIDNEKSLRYIGKSLAKNYIAFTLNDTILPYSTGKASKKVWLREGVNWKKTFSFGHCPNYLNPPPLPPPDPNSGNLVLFFGRQDLKVTWGEGREIY